MDFEFIDKYTFLFERNLFRRENIVAKSIVSIGFKFKWRPFKFRPDFFPHPMMNDNPIDDDYPESMFGPRGPWPLPLMGPQRHL